MRRTGLLLTLLFHGGWSVDNAGCETDVDCAAGARHAKTLLSTEEDKVEAQNRLYSALETQSAKPRHDGASKIADARKDTETFAVIPSRPRRVYSCPRRSAASPTGTSRR